jgi:hypothetical protein
VFCGAESGVPISTVTDSSVVEFSQVQPAFRLLRVVDLPCTEAPSNDEMSCGETIEHAFMGFAAWVASGPDEPPGALPGLLWD